MLRAASKTTLEKCSYGLQQSVRLQGTQAAVPKKGGFGKKLVMVTGLAAAASGGTLAYAYFDPSFRGKVEETVPYSKEVFQYTFGAGPAALEQARQQMSDLKDRVSKALPSAKKLKDEEEQKPLLRLDPLPPMQPPPKARVVVDPVDIRALPSEISSTTSVDSEVRRKRNKDLEESLKAALASSTLKVQSATDAKIATIAAINDHSKMLKKAVDDGQNANWDKVAEALERVEKLSRIDAAEENNARNYLDNMWKVVSDGRFSDATRDNPLLVNSSETANKLGQQLDELNALVHKSRNESRVMNQYRDLIDKSRRQFALELKSILPSVDINAKDSKLTEEDLNALIAHAHLKVDQLKRQLTDQQVHEEQNIAKAIEHQRIADAQLAEEQLMLEMKRVRDQSDVDLERKVLDSRKQWEQELEDRLRRAASAHSEHLEQVVRTQRQLYDIEQNQKIEDAVSRERSLHSRQISVAQGRLEGIEAALNSRSAADVEIRRSKQFWIACQNLVDSVVHGRKGGADIDARRKPLATELQVIKEACCDDEFVVKLLNALSNESIYNGVCTEQDLKTRFHRLYKTARRVAKVDENGAGILRYLSSYVQNAMTFDLPRKFSYEDKIDPNTLDTHEILARAKFLVENDDLSSAVRIVQLLKGEPARVARDWIADTRAHLETRLVAELLVAHAAVTSIRAVY